MADDRSIDRRELLVNTEAEQARVYSRNPYLVWFSAAPLLLCWLCAAHCLLVFVGVANPAIRSSDAVDGGNSSA